VDTELVNVSVLLEVDVALSVAVPLKVDVGLIVAVPVEVIVPLEVLVGVLQAIQPAQPLLTPCMLGKNGSGVMTNFSIYSISPCMDFIIAK
jgi:hypothetical protein